MKITAVIVSTHANRTNALNVWQMTKILINSKQPVVSVTPHGSSWVKMTITSLGLKKSTTDKHSSFAPPMVDTWQRFHLNLSLHNLQNIWKVCFKPTALLHCCILLIVLICKLLQGENCYLLFGLQAVLGQNTLPILGANSMHQRSPISLENVLVLTRKMDFWSTMSVVLPGDNRSNGSFCPLPLLLLCFTFYTFCFFFAAPVICLCVNPKGEILLLLLLVVDVFVVDCYYVTTIT